MLAEQRDGVCGEGFACSTWVGKGLCARKAVS